MKTTEITRLKSGHKLTKETKEKRLALYAEIMADPIHCDLTQRQISRRLGVSRATLYAWQSDPDLAEMVKAARARRMVQRLPKIDNAMADSAVEDGDVKAAALVYERWDGYVPHQRIDQNTTVLPSGKMETVLGKLDEILGSVLNRLPGRSLELKAETPKHASSQRAH